MLIECNYIADMVDMDIPNYEHKILGHCELETCKGIVETNKSDALQNVILCHTAKRNLRIRIELLQRLRKSFLAQM